MRSFKRVSESQFSLACRTGLAGWRADSSDKMHPDMRVRRVMLLALVVAAMAAPSVQTRSQLLFSSEDSSATTGVTPPGKLDLTYDRPTQRTELNNHVFDAFGPYSIAVVGVAAGINQWSGAPPEWNQGAEGFGKRFGSDFAIAAIGTTTRYTLAEAFKEDTLYYRCERRSPFPRLRHAVISTLTGRRGEDGHRVFSFPVLVAPYAGSMTAVYGWYPNRFGAKSAFRIGNYSPLRYMGGNIALEFFYSGPHALITRMHMNNRHGSPIQGPNQ